MKQLNYKLLCPVCDSLFDDDGFLLACPQAHAPALLTTRYSSRRFERDHKVADLYRYQCWLPDAKRLAHAPIPVTYQSKALSSFLSLPNLWIAFSGYWPERGAALETGTFKELEVCGVLSRIPAQNFRALVVASAGNTGAAFASSCSQNDVPCLVIVPAFGMSRMRFAEKLQPCVKIVSLTGGASYSDAIALAELISREDGFICEGGVRNVGRRDGMATAMLNAVDTIGRLPDYYFQAIGSGAGAIAAHEAAKRLVVDSRFGSILPRLMLSQNAPFIPIYDSWKKGRRDFVPVAPEDAPALTQKILAKVLSNQRPPYSITGGVFDVLQESHGDMFAVQNREVVQAMRIFQKYEGIDLEPAAGVALASLIQAINSRAIDSAATVLLHITGAGARKRAAEKTLFATFPHIELPLADVYSPRAVELACGLFAAKNALAYTASARS